MQPPGPPIRHQPHRHVWLMAQLIGAGLAPGTGPSLGSSPPPAPRAAGQKLTPRLPAPLGSCSAPARQASQDTASPGLPWRPHTGARASDRDPRLPAVGLDRTTVAASLRDPPCSPQPPACHPRALFHPHSPPRSHPSGPAPGRPRAPYLTKKEAAADAPAAGVPGAGETRAVVQAPPRPHVLDAPSGPPEGGPSRTVSATATAATAASACGERPVRDGAPAAPARQPRPAQALPAQGAGRSGPGRGRCPPGARLRRPSSIESQECMATAARTEGQAPRPAPRAVHPGAPDASLGETLR